MTIPARPAAEPRGEVGEEARRAFVAPLRVVEREEDRRAVLQRHDEPQQPVQRREARVARGRVAAAEPEHLRRALRRAGEQRVALGAASPRTWASKSWRTAPNANPRSSGPQRARSARAER
jgi:hypothetical protein